MSRFKKAQSTDIRLKALVYGPAGCGKTVTALQFPDPYVIDGERGTEHYATSFKFNVDRTSSVNDLLLDVHELIADPTLAKTLVIDPITVFMDNLVIEYTRKLRLKKGIPDYELQPADHGPLKQKRKEIIDRLLSLDLNIVCTARAKIKYKQDGKNFMIPDGFEPEVPKELPYLFDTIIRIEIAPDGKTRLAYTEKDRTNKLPPVFEFTYDKMVEIMGLDSLERVPDPEHGKRSLDEASGRAHEIKFRGKTVRTAGIEETTLESILLAASKADISDTDLISMLSDSYGCSSLYDLKDDEGRYLVQTLENQVGENRGL